MPPQPNKTEPLVVMNLFWAWWGRWWSPKASSFHRHQDSDQKLYELSNCSVAARCQHFLLLSCSATFEHQLNFKLIGSLINCWGAASSNAWPQVRTPGQLLPSLVAVTPRMSQLEVSSPCGRLDFFLGPGRGGAPGLRLLRMAAGLCPFTGSSRC